MDLVLSPPAVHFGRARLLRCSATAAESAPVLRGPCSHVHALRNGGWPPAPPQLRTCNTQTCGLRATGTPTDGWMEWRVETFDRFARVGGAGILCARVQVTSRGKQIYESTWVAPCRRIGRVRGGDVTLMLLSAPKFHLQAALATADMHAYYDRRHFCIMFFSLKLSEIHSNMPSGTRVMMSACALIVRSKAKKAFRNWLNPCFAVSSDLVDAHGAVCEAEPTDKSAMSCGCIFVTPAPKVRHRLLKPGVYCKVHIHVDASGGACCVHCAKCQQRETRLRVLRLWRAPDMGTAHHAAQCQNDGMGVGRLVRGVRGA